MIYKRRRKSSSEPGGYFLLENEQNHKKVSGFGHGSSIKLEDTAGSVWRGSAERGDDQAVYYRFRTEDGQVVSGIGYGGSVMLRDEKGLVWKGLVD
jgi:predicted metalloprotease with PDZ domain